jgi:hypothetical protein
LAAGLEGLDDGSEIPNLDAAEPAAMPAGPGSSQYGGEQRKPTQDIEGIASFESGDPAT